MKQDIINQIAKYIPLSEKDVYLIKSKLTFKKIKASDVLHLEGNVCNYEAFVLKGVLRSFYNINGNERIISFFQENQWIGDFKSFLSQEPSKITIQAINDCELILLTRDSILELSNQIPKWNKLGELFYKNLSFQKDKHIESLLLKTPEERYFTLLKKDPKLINSVPQYMIAQYIGIQPESLSRIRKRSIS